MTGLYESEDSMPERILTAKEHRRWSAVDDLCDALLENELCGNRLGARLAGDFGDTVPDEPVFNSWYCTFVNSLPSYLSARWGQRDNDRWVGIRYKGQEFRENLESADTIEGLDSIQPPPLEVSRRLVRLLVDATPQEAST